MDLDARVLRAYGIALRDTTMLAKAYDSCKGVVMLPIQGRALSILDLSSLPTDPIPFKEVFLRWAMQANEPRIRAGEEPVFPYELVRACPLWRFVPMPIRAVRPTQEGMFNKLAPKGKLEKPTSIGSINKSSTKKQ